eukprot:Nk52_evm21s236 gene=Nk52_evmTU21s236
MDGSDEDLMRDRGTSEGVKSTGATGIFNRNNKIADESSIGQEVPFNQESGEDEKPRGDGSELLDEEETTPTLNGTCEENAALDGEYSQSYKPDQPGEFEILERPDKRKSTVGRISSFNKKVFELGNLKTHKIGSSIYKLVDISTNSQIFEESKISPLHWIVYETVRGVRELNEDTESDIRTQHGHLVNTQDGQGLTPLHLAICEGSGESLAPMLLAVKITRILISMGADLEMHDKNGRTSLHMACGRGNLDLVRLLLENGANIWALTKERQSVIHMAARYDNEILLKQFFMLIRAEKGEQDCMEIFDQVTPFTNCSEKPVTCSPSVVEARDARDIRDMTPLHVAVFFGMTASAEFLLSMGASIETRDKNGTPVIATMLEEIPALVPRALDNLVVVNKFARKTMYNLCPLEKKPKDTSEGVATHNMTNKSVLKILVHNSLLDIVSHSVIKKFIEMKWEKFGWWNVFKSMAFYCIFVILVTISATLDKKGDRNSFSKSTMDRAVVDACSIMMLFIFVLIEIREAMGRTREAALYVSARSKEIENMLLYVPLDDSWPDGQFLQDKLKSVQKATSIFEYFADPWNWLDWICYLSLVLSHALNYSQINNDEHGNEDHPPSERASLYFYIIGTIFAYLKLAKFARAYERMGAFVVMLTKMFNDVVNFLIIYGVLLIPFALSFLLVFRPEIKGSDDYLDFWHVSMTLFRMTLVDFTYSDLEAVEPVVAPILVSIWLFTSGVLLINLFIAMMSNTYQIVQDNANNVALLERAAAIVASEETELSEASQLEMRQWIYENCSETNPFIEKFSEAESLTEDPIVSLRQTISDKVDVLDKKIARLALYLEDKDPELRSNLADSRESLQIKELYSKMKKQASINSYRKAGDSSGPFNPKQLTADSAAHRPEQPLNHAGASDMSDGEESVGELTVDVRS